MYFKRIISSVMASILLITTVNINALAETKLQKPAGTIVNNGAAITEEIYNEFFSLYNAGTSSEPIDDTIPIVYTGDIVIDNIPQGLNPITLSYNEIGLNDHVIDTKNNHVVHEYNDKGKIIKTTIKDKSGNVQLITEYSYTKLGRIKTLESKNLNGKHMVNLSFDYDGYDNLILKKDNTTGNYVEYKYHKTKKFSNDRYHQLTDEIYFDVDGKVLKKISYQNDKSGNRQKKDVKIDKENIKTEYQYSKDNLLIEIDGQTVLYDKNENILDDGNVKNQFNTENQLIESRVQDSIISYGYKDENVRVSKKVNDEIIYYNYFAGDIVWITDQDHELKYFFTRDDNDTLLNFIDYTLDTPRTYWYLLDDHKNVLGLLDENGQMVVSYEYDAWGNIISEIGDVVTGDGKLLREENPFRYSSYPYDVETRYYYLKARYYDPRTGRFISKDSFINHLGDPLHQNPYLYCVNNPVNFSDPTGHIKLSITSSGDEVITLQVKLAVLGYLQIPYDSWHGHYDSWTQLAVKNYQADNGLVADGIVGDLTWNKLMQPGEFYLARGSENAKVAKLQQELNRLGYNVGEVDQTFGTQTLNGVLAYKDAVGAGNQGAARGRIGAGTWFTHLFPLGDVNLTMDAKVQVGVPTIINVSSKNAHHVGIQIIKPDGTGEWFVQNGENLSLIFTPTMTGSYLINGASRNTGGSDDLYTQRKQALSQLLFVDASTPMKIIRAKEQLNTLRYYNSDDFSGNGSSEYNEAKWDFIREYGIQKVYAESNYNDDIFYFWLERAVLEFSNNLSEIDNEISIDLFISKLKELESLYTLYITRGNAAQLNYDDVDSAKVSNDTIIGFIRGQRYSGLQWTVTAGSSVKHFADYVKINNAPLFEFFHGTGENELFVRDPITGKGIEFTHLLAVLDGLYDFGNMQFFLIRDSWVGYGGDLQTVVVDVQHYHNENANQTYDYAARILIGTDHSASSFQHTDLLGDIDAVNLSQIISDKMNMSLSEAIEKYYVAEKLTEVTKRYSNFVNVEGGIHKLEQEVRNNLTIISESEELGIITTGPKTMERLAKEGIRLTPEALESTINAFMELIYLNTD